MLTAPGAAAIAVARVVGENVEKFLLARFSRPVAPGGVAHGELGDDGGVIDDPVVLLSADGRSAELHLHGGPAVVAAVLELLRRDGFAVAEGVELPLPDDAVDAATLLQREALAYLPLAKTELAVRVLLGQFAAWGELKRDANSPYLRERLEGILADRTMERLLHPPRVAIVGAANVGKSTIANQLFAQERSITADLAGTTRDWVGEIANLDGVAVMLVDTPGQRATDDPLEAQAIEQSREQIASADVVVLVLDRSRPMDVDQSRLVAMHRDAILVINQCDREPAWDDADLLAVRTTATRGEGIDKLRATIRQRLHCDEIDIAAPRCWTPRQRAVIEQAIADATVLREV